MMEANAHPTKFRDLDTIDEYPQADTLSEEPTLPSTLERAKSLTHKVKAAAHRLLEDNNDGPKTEVDHDDMFEDAAYNPQKVLQPTQVNRASIRNRLHRGARAIADAAKNPRRSITNTYTRKTATKISRRHHDGAAEYDEALIDAHNALEDAKAPQDSSSIEGTCHESSRKVEEAQHQIDQIKEKRESVRSAWVLGRHVKRAKVVQPMEIPPDKADFIEPTAPGEPPKTLWAQYIGHLMLWHTRNFTAQHIDDYDEPPFDLTELANVVERLAVISTPWQIFFMEVRDIYMWTDPQRTMKWMILYWVLWYFQYTISFVIVWLIYSTIKNKLDPGDLETLRERVDRAQNHSTKAKAWSELIIRHGKQDWVEPIIDEFGPVVQLQLSDIANYLEILQNFYRWERPEKTLATLFYFICAFSVITFTSMEFCVKLVWLHIGCIFFYAFPIATHYPKYRHLVNPYYWIYWDIPNTAELAIIQLQEKAVLNDAKLLDRATTLSDSPEYPHSLDGYSSDTAYDSDNHDLASSSISSTTNLSTPQAKALTAIRAGQSQTFRAVIMSTYTHSRLTLTRTGLWLYNKNEKNFHSFSTLLELQKLDLGSNSDDNESKPRTSMAQLKETFKNLSTAQYIPTGLTFIFRSNPSTIATKLDASRAKLPQHAISPNEAQHKITLIVSESDRDKIFNVILSWSNVKWQPLYSMDRQNLMGGRDGEGQDNRNLDHAIKNAMKSL